MDTDVNAETLRELKQEAAMERFVHSDRSDAGGCRVCSEGFQKQKRRHICIVFRIELKRVHEIASL